MERALAFASNARRVVGGVLRAGDAAVVFVAGFVSYWLRHGNLDLPENYLVAVVIGTLLTINYHHMGRLYEFRNLRSLARQFGPLTVSWVAVILTLIALGYFTKTSDTFSRIWMSLWLGMNLGGFLLLRLGAVLQLESWRRKGKLRTNLAIAGSGDLGASLVSHLQERGDPALQLVGIFDDESPGTPTGEGERALSGSISDLLHLVRDNVVDEIVVALPLQAKDRLSSILTKLQAVPVDVRLCPEIVELSVPIHGYSVRAGMPMLDVFERPLGGWSLIVKTIEDYILGSLLLVLFLPVMALIAMAIRLEGPGPILFRQPRYGFNNNEFAVFKFRTMGVEAGEDSHVPQAQRNDPRVTRVGAFLRRTSLDELPQLFNVIKGQMSIVGPRPHAVAHNKHYAKIINEYLGRHKVKPGITGWAQINGLRGETDTPDKMQRRVEYDLFYIEHWSLSFDLRIIFLTPFVILVDSHAY